MPSIMITSANRGLGLEFARQYAADGWRIFAACRNPDVATDLRELARAGSVTIFPMDVTDPHSVKRAATDFVNEAIDILVNSAGIFGKQNQKTGNVDYESWKEVLDTNTLGPLRVTEAFTDHVARSERKLVVTITSGMGSLADNTSGDAIPYRSSKAAVNMVMRSAAIDLAPHGIGCVLVNPGGSRLIWVAPGRHSRRSKAWQRSNASLLHSDWLSPEGSLITTVANIPGEASASQLRRTSWNPGT